MNHGDCFFNKAAPGVPSHPWVIISDSAQNPTDVVIVNLTDADKYFDQTCILDVADFPGWITKRSAVAFQKANVTSIAALGQAEKAGLIFNKSHMPAAALNKIIAALPAADELKNNCKMLLIQQGFIT
jgi:hypothetical protein